MYKYIIMFEFYKISQLFWLQIKEKTLKLFSVTAKSCPH